ncbi:MAG: Rrf2 family transcriptional regulator [Kiritimatiellae bacterium]|nr:Rrf2 family transcriptional regulator [Kiritimatiellia bacterium]
MKLSTRSRYGLRLMFELALGYGTGAVQLQDIAKNQNISEKYLGKLMIQLKKAKLVDSIRGAHGGYILQREPSKITMLDIVKVMEGDLSIVDCTSDGADCCRAHDCPSKSVWCGLSNVIKNYLEGIKLSDLVDKYNKSTELSQQMYFI